MKKINKLMILSLSFLMTIPTMIKNNDYSLTCSVIDEINEQANIEKSIIRKENNEELSYSQMYVQHGYNQEDNKHYLRFATAIKVDTAESLSYKMTINDEEYVNGDKEAFILYKSIVSNGVKQYFNGTEITEEANENYLWTCYVIKFESDNHILDNIKVTLKINDKVEVSKETILETEIKNEYQSNITSVSLENDNNIIYWVFKFENYGYTVEDYEFYDDGDVIFDIANSEINNGIAIFKIDVTNLENSHYPHLKLKGEKISETGDIMLSEDAYDENGMIEQVVANNCTYSLKRLNDDSTMPIISIKRDYVCSAKTAFVSLENDHVYWNFTFDNVWYKLEDYEFLGDNETKLETIGEINGNIVTFKIDVTNFDNGTTYPHLKIKGEYYSVGGSDAGDIKGGDLIFNDGEQVVFNNKTYSIIKEYDMPTMRIKDVKEKLIRQDVYLSQEDNKIYYNFKFFSYYGCNYDYNQTSFVICDGDRSVTFGKDGLSIEVNGAYIVLKIDVLNIDTNNDFYPHLKINGTAWAEDGSADNGDIKGYNVENDTIIQEIENEGKTYQIVALWSMPVLRVK